MRASRFHEEGVRLGVGFFARLRDVWMLLPLLLLLLLDDTPSSSVAFTLCSRS